MIVAIMFLCFASVTAANQEISPSQKFTGKIADPNLSGAAPESGIVGDLATWKKLWSTWRPNEPVSEVDFQTNLVLVNTAPGPNTVFSNLLKLNDAGELNFETASTRMAGPGFGYLITVVPKAGIQSVNGWSVDGRPLEPKPDPSDVDPGLAVKESVSVEIVGRVRTGFQLVDAETTGTLVAANGIVWELDFHNDESLMNAAQRIGDSLARITGSLSIERQRGEVEARVRWILLVDTFESLGLQPATSPLSANNPLIRPANNDSPAENPRLTPADPKPVAAAPTETDAENPPDQTTPLVEPMRDSPNPIESNRDSFRQIVIETSDGQSQSIRSDGVVEYQSKSKNTANSWSADRSTMVKLHEFVAETSWDLVPRATRSKSNDQNEISYTISIETANSVTRMFIDRSAVPDQPTMKKLFDIISEMARN